MKTNLTLLTAFSLLLVACGEKTTEATTHAYEIDLGENPYFLTTDLPQESELGTPVPIHLRGVNSVPIPAEKSTTPGIGRVIYRRSQDQAAHKHAGSGNE